MERTLYETAGVIISFQREIRWSRVSVSHMRALSLLATLLQFSVVKCYKRNINRYYVG